MRVKTAIVMPSINVPPNLIEWADQLDAEDMIIVVGSERSPHDGSMSLLDAINEKYDVRTMYLHPDDEVTNAYMITDRMPLNDHCRHALGLLEAMRYRPQVIINLDDDNFPVSKFWVATARHVLLNPNRNMSVLESPNGWFNPGSLCTPSVVHRGFPSTIRHEKPLLVHNAPAGERIGVFGALWVGDPDVDAVERICHDPTVTGVKPTVVVHSNTHTVFNSQSTAIRGELAPLYVMWPHVGRYDDIWAAYLTYAYMRANHYHAAFGQPAVRQDRNPHNLIKDLENEMLGYRLNTRVIEVLTEAGFETAGATPHEGMKLLVERISRHLSTELPTETIEALNRWVYDINTMDYLEDPDD